MQSRVMSNDIFFGMGARAPAASARAESTNSHDQIISQIALQNKLGVSPDFLSVAGLPKRGADWFLQEEDPMVLQFGTDNVYELIGGHKGTAGYRRQIAGSLSNFTGFPVLAEDLTVSAGEPDVLDRLSCLFCTEESEALQSRPVVFAERKSFFVARAMFSTADVVAIDMDEDGMVIEHLQEMLAEHSAPALLYAVPTFHTATPDGTLSFDRRQLLGELAVKHGFPVATWNFSGRPQRFAHYSERDAQAVDTCPIPMPAAQVAFETT
jgi:hypothetical protein